MIGSTGVAREQLEEASGYVIGEELTALQLSGTELTASRILAPPQPPELSILLPPHWNVRAAQPCSTASPSYHGAGVGLAQGAGAPEGEAGVLCGGGLAEGFVEQARGLRWLPKEPPGGAGAKAGGTWDTMGHQ